MLIVLLALLAVPPGERYQAQYEADRQANPACYAKALQETKPQFSSTQMMMEQRARFYDCTEQK